MASDKAWDDMSKLLKQFIQMPDAGKCKEEWQMIMVTLRNTHCCCSVCACIISARRFMRVLSMCAL